MKKKIQTKILKFFVIFKKQPKHWINNCKMLAKEMICSKFFNFYIKQLLLFYSLAFIYHINVFCKYPNVNS